MELTRAENTVFELLKCGYDREEISEKLGIALNTVKTLETRAYKKTGIKGRMELLAGIVKNHIKEVVDIN